MSHDPNIERSVAMHKREVIMDMADKVETVMNTFPGIVKDQSLLYNIAGDIPIDEEKMNEIAKLKILSLLLDMSYDELRDYLGYEEEVQNDTTGETLYEDDTEAYSFGDPNKYCEYCGDRYTQEHPKSSHMYKCWKYGLGKPNLTQKNAPKKIPDYLTLSTILKHKSKNLSDSES